MRKIEKYFQKKKSSHHCLLIQKLTAPAEDKIGTKLFYIFAIGDYMTAKWKILLLYIHELSTI